MSRVQAAISDPAQMTRFVDYCRKEEGEAARMLLLKELAKIRDEQCLQRFLDLQGLTLLAGWLAPMPKLVAKIVQCLENMPLPSTTILIKSDIKVELEKAKTALASTASATLLNSMQRVLHKWVGTERPQKSVLKRSSTITARAGDGDNVEEGEPSAKRPKKQVQRSVTWAAPDKLVSVLLYTIDKTGKRHARKELKDRYPGKDKHPRNLSKKEELEDMDEQIAWSVPLEIEVPEDSKITAGAESAQRGVEELREKSVLATFYLKKNSIPDNPTFLDEDKDEEYDEAAVPIFPNEDIEETDAEEKVQVKTETTPTPAERVTDTAPLPVLDAKTAQALLDQLSAIPSKPTASIAGAGPAEGAAGAGATGSDNKVFAALLSNPSLLNGILGWGGASGANGVGGVNGVGGGGVAAQSNGRGVRDATTPAPTSSTIDNDTQNALLKAVTSLPMTLPVPHALTLPVPVASSPAPIHSLHSAPAPAPAAYPVNTHAEPQAHTYPTHPTHTPVVYNPHHPAYAQTHAPHTHAPTHPHGHAQTPRLSRSPPRERQYQGYQQHGYADHGSEAPSWTSRPRERSRERSHERSQHGGRRSQERERDRGGGGHRDRERDRHRGGPPRDRRETGFRPVRDIRDGGGDRGGRGGGGGNGGNGDWGFGGYTSRPPGRSGTANAYGIPFRPKTKRCKWFQSTTGCRSGQSCTFLHE